MKVLRLAVLFLGNGHSKATARQCVAALDDTAGLESIHRHSHPHGDPTVFLYLDQSAGPALHYYIDEDGSFLVIDGDIFNLDEIASDEVRDQRNPAKSLFELYRSRGEEVFA
jgi:hypothetical protein